MPTSLTKQYPQVRGATKLMRFPEAASQTFKKGDIVQLDSNGRVAIGVAAGSNMDSQSNVRILGKALQDATGTTGSTIEVQVFTADTEIKLPITHATPASAVTAIAQLYKTAVTAGYQLENSASTGWAVPIDDTTNPLVTITEIDEEYPVGERYGLVWVKVLPAALWFAA